MVWKTDECKTLFREIKTYEEAYYYNSNMENRLKYDFKNFKAKKKGMKNENKGHKVKENFLGILGEIFEFTIEILISILD